jgi:glutathione S-transferase
MLKLYHSMGSRSFRALWVLEEAHIPYDLIVLPFPPRATHKGYRAINPLGTVPTFFDGEHMMTESSAICQYVAACYAAETLAVMPGDPRYAAYLNFMHMGEATLTFPQTIYFRYSVLEPVEKRQPTVANDYRLWFASRLKNAATLFQGRAYVCGDRFTAADISFGYALGFASHLDLADHFPDSISEYWKRLKSREGFQRACEKEIQASTDQGVKVERINY